MKKTFITIAVIIVVAAISYFVYGYFSAVRQSQVTKTVLGNLSAEPNFFKGITPAQKRALDSLAATSSQSATSSNSNEQNILDSLQAK